MVQKILITSPIPRLLIKGKECNVGELENSRVKMSEEFQGVLRRDRKPTDELKDECRKKVLIW